jgi:hypothetical protein
MDARLVSGCRRPASKQEGWPWTTAGRVNRFSARDTAKLIRDSGDAEVRDRLLSLLWSDFFVLADKDWAHKRYGT